MTAPNIRNPSSIIGKTNITSNLTTSLANVLTNASASGKVFKINSIFAANISGTTDGSVSVAIYDANTSTTCYLAYTIDVPADSTQVISTKETYFYVQENVSIQASRATANISLTIGYEEIS